MGAIATLALPPISFFPLLFLVFPPLVWLLNGAKRKRSAFAVGWWFGFGFFVFGLYWTGNALLVFANKFAIFLPFAIAGLPALLALFIGAATLIAWFAQGSLNRAISLAMSWVAGEWLRSHILTGFPWNLIGYAWADNEGLVQLAALFGIFGVSLAVVLSACLPAALADHQSPWRIAAAATALPLLVWIGGTLRLSSAPEMAYVDGVGLRIVQSNIPQREKWAAAYQERNLHQFLELSHKNRPHWITHIIWPETAATFLPSSNPGLRHALSAIVPAGGLLLTGALRRIDNSSRVANTMVALNETGHIIAHYDKFHLVPFGEYVPLANILPIEKITPGKRGFTPGPGVRTLTLAGLPPFSPLICYEVIFPGDVADRAQRPAWLLNLTNDAWYGISAGPHQHFAQARVRAVEEGLPLIRAAYTGISAVIGPYGHILQTQGLNEPGVIDTRLPRGVSAPPYSQWGDIPLGVILLLLSLLYCSFCVKNMSHNEQ